jgi:hypothetical protein
MPADIKNYTLLGRGEESLKKIDKNSKHGTLKWAVSGIVCVALLFVGIVIYLAPQNPNANEIWENGASTALSACPQYPALKAPSRDEELFEQHIHNVIESDAFFDWSLHNMQSAIRIATESFDDMGPVGEDARWSIFDDFHASLEMSFPLVYVLCMILPRSILIKLILIL